MCEEKITKMKKDMRLARRRARRLLQIYDFVAHPSAAAPTHVPADSDSDSEQSTPLQHPQRLSQRESIACLQNVAARTVVLMQRNEEIQRRVLELKRETAQYLTSVMKNPVKQKRFLHILGTPTPFHTPPESEDISETSSVHSADDSRSLPDVDDSRANDSFDVKLKLECNDD